MGGDAWLCLLQGLRIGAESKVGFYNTRAKQQTAASSSISGPLLLEAATGNEGAFMGEASVSVVADILPSVSLRGGYQVFYMKNVALAANNFNPVAPGNAARHTLLRDRSEAVYHGFSAGLDYIY